MPPCDSIVLNQVHLRLANKELLAAALKDLGADMVGQSGRGEMSFRLRGQAYSIQNGELVSQDRNVGQVADEIKQAYGRAVVKRAASRFGFSVKQTQRNRMIVTKRG